MHWFAVLIACLVGLAVVAGVTALLAVLLLAFVAAPSFWGAFWLVLVVLVVFTSASKAL
ncbi:hypothetical protein SEA_BAJUNIPER_59 [Microbacterium phage BAjuniper]|nr:hypothetical protein SEA_BAJUNIPER_59 [Microbacterium phage BAjuniper]